jgi:hypothetical protein
VFEWLESSALAIWVGESLWGYPIMLGLHAIGLAIVVGIFLMLDLRLLRVIRGVSFEGLRSLVRLAWLGLLINMLSGTALFSSQATTFIESVPFLTKITCVLAGVILGVLLQRQLAASAVNWDAADSNIGIVAKLSALLSMLCWIGAIFAGRLIAYL